MRLNKLFILLGIFLLSLNFIFALDSYRVNVGETVEIDEHGLCWQVTNNGLLDLMVPTKNESEWLSFNNSVPVNISLEECGRNNFGDGRDGYIWVKSDGIYQSFNGVNYNKIYENTMWPSVQDGDMVVINSIDFKVDEGVTFTTTNRCRGLMIYTTGDMTVNGTISMTARGAHANPADSISTVNTPVVSSDGNAVPVEGLVIRREKKDWSDITNEIINNAHANSVNDFKGSHNSNNLFYGTGLNAVLTESNQEEVENGLVIKIPRVGGSGALNQNSVGGKTRNGYAGGTIMFGTGGGGSGSAYIADGYAHAYTGKGATGTIFSGGSASGGAQSCKTIDATLYGGKGSNGCRNPKHGDGQGGGAGNPGGGTDGSWYGLPGDDGTGGLLVMFIGKEFVNNGIIESKGSNGGTKNIQGGSSGGGIVLILYAGNLINNGIFNAQGGYGFNGGYGTRSGAGGKGSIIGPIKISKGFDPCDYGKIRVNGICQDVHWEELNDWSDCSVLCGSGIQTQTIACKTTDGSIISDNFCDGLAKPSNVRVCDAGACPLSQDISNLVNTYAALEGATSWFSVIDDETHCNGGSPVEYCEHNRKFPGYINPIIPTEGAFRLKIKPLNQEGNNYSIKVTAQIWPRYGNRCQSGYILLRNANNLSQTINSGVKTVCGSSTTASINTVIPKTWFDAQGRIYVDFYTRCASHNWNEGFIKPIYFSWEIVN